MGLNPQFSSASAKEPPRIPESNDLRACNPALRRTIHLHQNIPVAIGPDGNDDIGKKNVKGLEKPFEVAVKINTDSISRLKECFRRKKMVARRLLFSVLILGVVHAGSEHPLANEIALGARTNPKLEDCSSLVTPRYKSNLRIKVPLDEQVFSAG